MDALRRGTSLSSRPYELMEYELCRHFGWTPDQARELDADDFDRYYWIMALSAQEDAIREK